MQLTLTYKFVYGNARYYPADDASRVICRLGGFKSFTHEQVNMMKNEGWELKMLADIPA